MPSEWSSKPASGIDVLVVGAGIGGLFCAIEMHRHGHSVRVVESNHDIYTLGDFIAVGPTVTRQFAKWPSMQETFDGIRYKTAITMLKYDGEQLTGPFSAEDATSIPSAVSRVKLQCAMHAYAVGLGISFRFGKNIEQYLDDPVHPKAVAVTKTGERFEADVIVAADGVGSKSWQLVQGTKTKAQSSGFAIYRVAFPTEIAHRDPEVAKAFPTSVDGLDAMRMYLGPETHAITMTSKETMNWLLTHKDSGTSTESWSKRLNADVVLHEMNKSGVDWDPTLKQLIKQTPDNTVIDWRLLWRDPVSKWVSDAGRVVQIGDAAHAFLPTSANGGTQACEDAISLAACLSLGGKDNTAMAARVHNTLRYQRVSCCQLNGFLNRERWHHTDFEAAKKNPEKLADMTGRWITEHDPEQYVYNNWKRCVDSLVTGQEFVNTNIPPGYKYYPWTIDEMMNGKNVELIEGDWS